MLAVYPLWGWRLSFSYSVIVNLINCNTFRQSTVKRLLICGTCTQYKGPSIMVLENWFPLSTSLPVSKRKWEEWVKTVFSNEQSSLFSRKPTWCKRCFKISSESPFRNFIKSELKLEMHKIGVIIPTYLSQEILQYRFKSPAQYKTSHK